MQYVLLFVSDHPVLVLVGLAILILCLCLSNAKIHTYKKTKEEETKMLRSELFSKKKSIQVLEQEVEDKNNEINALESDLSNRNSCFEKVMKSNITSIPWLAGIMADYLTIDIEVLAKKLDWGSNIERAKKVASIREIRASAKERIAEAKEAVYQLNYLLELYPGLEDVLSTDYKDLEFTGKIPDHDPALDYLSKEEWSSLPDVARDQLVLDRYIQSRNKSKWQIGRDYELSVAYEYQKKGYDVDTYGSFMKLEDMGRDLIAKKGKDTLIIQCKYWSQSKTIHEKHIFQLFGTTVSYCLETGKNSDDVHGIFVTNTKLSDMARKVAKQLNIHVAENHAMVDFPRIKCNIGRGEYGETTKIYHLPIDAQYDVAKINKAGEFYAFTVQEAVNAGFRRTYKWHGDS